MTMKMPEMGAIINIGIGILCSLVIWLIIFVPLFWFFPAFALFSLIFISLCLLTTKRYLSFSVYLLFSPPVLFFIFGIYGYFSGDARHIMKGKPAPIAYNLVREYRCWRSFAGCVVTGNEICDLVPNNLAIKLMSNLFGPMRGIYNGSYPTKEQALTALEKSEDIPIEKLSKGTIIVGDKHIQLNENFAEYFLKGFPIGDALNKGEAELNEYIEKFGTVKGVIYKNDCMIISVPIGFESDNETFMRNYFIALISIEHGKAFAYYSNGTYFRRRAYSDWKGNIQRENLSSKILSR